MALVDFGPRSAGAITVAPVDLLLLKREHFLHVLAEHPLLSFEIIRGLSAKLRFATSYIEKAITWSQRIARGEYKSAIAAIEEERCAPGGRCSAKEVQIDPLIAAFFSMAKDVRQREEQLKSQLLSLRIEIDAAKRNRQVAKITETEHFGELQAKARSMRGKISESPSE